jgi:hypothetical protein
LDTKHRKKLEPFEKEIFHELHTAILFDEGDPHVRSQMTKIADRAIEISMAEIMEEIRIRKKDKNRPVRKQGTMSSKTKSKPSKHKRSVSRSIGLKSNEHSVAELPNEEEDDNEGENKDSGHEFDPIKGQEINGDEAYEDSDTFTERLEDIKGMLVCIHQLINI